MAVPVTANLRKGKKAAPVWLFPSTIWLAALLCLAEQLAINGLIGSSHKVMELVSEHLVLKSVNLGVFMIS